MIVNNILIFICVLKIVFSQETCPNIFKPIFKSVKWTGNITVPSDGFGITTLKIEYVPIKNSQNRTGTLQLLNQQNLLNDILKRRDLTYFIEFPRSKELPKITSIKVNNHEYCLGNSDERKLVIKHSFQFPFPKTSSDLTSLKTVSNDNKWLMNLEFSNQCGYQNKSNDNVAGIIPTIYNGEKVKPHEFPWLVALFNLPQYQFFCGGSLISNKHVITAAHCTSGKDWIYMEFARHNIRQNEATVVKPKVSEKIIQHPDYVVLTGHADISIVVLSEPVEFSENIRPICLWPFGTELDYTINGTIVGWGADNSATLTPTPMKITHVKIVSLEMCLAAHPLLLNITSNQTFCADSNQGPNEGLHRGPCTGDSGGGMYIEENGRWYLRGVVSTSIGYNYCDVDVPSVHVDVAHYLDWIKNSLVN